MVRFECRMWEILILKSISPTLKFHDIIFLVDILIIGQLENLLMLKIFQKRPLNRRLFSTIYQINRLIDLLIGNHMEFL